MEIDTENFYQSVLVLSVCFCIGLIFRYVHSVCKTNRKKPESIVKKSRAPMKVVAAWQSHFHDVPARALHVMLTRKWSNVRFLVGVGRNRRVFAAHKIILAMTSPVFEAMFFGNLPEADGADIVIPDIQPYIFSTLLFHIYMNEPIIDSFEDACELWYAAEKYMLANLVRKCVEYLMESLSSHNVLRAYEVAKLFDDALLKEKCWRFICEETLEVLADDSFLNITASTLLEIYDSNKLKIHSELDLFHGLLKLVADKDLFADNPAALSAQPNANQNPNVQPVSAPVVSNTIDEIVIRQAVKKIRFLTLIPEQFAEGPAISKLLSKDEIVIIFINISSRTYGREMCIWPDGFSDALLFRGS